MAGSCTDEVSCMRWMLTNWFLSSSLLYCSPISLYGLFIARTARQAGTGASGLQKQMLQTYRSVHAVDLPLLRRSAPNTFYNCWVLFSLICRGTRYMHDDVVIDSLYVPICVSTSTVTVHHTTRIHRRSLKRSVSMHYISPRVRLSFVAGSTLRRATFSGLACLVRDMTHFVRPAACSCGTD